MIILKPVPGRTRAIVGAHEEAQGAIDNFLVEAKKYITDNFGENPSFEIKSQEMKLSDNKLTYLVYNNCCVAGVFERRTEFNNLEYIFFRDLTQLESKFKTGQ
ncbi:MAG: hypothetical protein AABY32_05455 [Nanoarchaeota archaeon]